MNSQKIVSIHHTFGSVQTFCKIGRYFSIVFGKYSLLILLVADVPKKVSLVQQMENFQAKQRTGSIDRHHITRRCTNQSMNTSKGTCACTCKQKYKHIHVCIPPAHAHMHAHTHTNSQFSHQSMGGALPKHEI